MSSPTASASARGAVYTRLTRLRAALENAVATSLLLRHGRGQCDELDLLASKHRTQGLARESRRILQSHVEDCARCQESKGLYASPAQILAGLALVPPPEGLTEAAWVILGGGLAGAGAVAASGKTGALGGALSQAPVPLGVAAGGFATLATIAALGVWVVAGGGDEGTRAATPQPSSPQAAQSSPPAPKTTRAVRQNALLRKQATARTRPAATATEVRVGLTRSAQAPGEAAAATPPATRSVLAPPPEADPPPTPPPPPPSPAPPPAPAPESPPPPPRPRRLLPLRRPLRLHRRRRLLRRLLRLLLRLLLHLHPPPPPVEDKVTICLGGNTMIVPSSAVPGYLAVGATLGSCPIVGDDPLP